MEKVAVSIIMPVYNSQEYLEETIKSVLKNNFQDFELLCIDDGSTDESGAILDRLAGTDERLRVIHKENSGVSDTRNYGISIAKGEYIGFCDNDDLVSDDFIKDNYEFAKRHNLDVLKFGAERILTDKGKVIFQKQLVIGKGVFEGDEIYKKYSITQMIIGAVWDHLYKKEVLINNNIKFPEYFEGGYEDINFNTAVLDKSNKIGFNGDKVYYHWMNREEHSTSRKFIPKFFDGVIESMELEISLYHKHKTEIKNLDFFKVLLERYLNCYLESLVLKDCNWSISKRANSLKKVRENSIFNEINLNKDEERQLKNNVKTYIYYKLFIGNNLNLLILLKMIYNRIRKI